LSVGGAGDSVITRTQGSDGEHVGHAVAYAGEGARATKCGPFFSRGLRRGLRSCAAGGWIRYGTRDASGL